jgi:glycerol kinase
MAKYILALDSGTTSNRAILFDHNGHIVSSAQQEFPQIYPNPGWVEHDPMAIWNTQFQVAREALKRLHAEPEDIAAIGITNQRETTVVWDRETGNPVYNAIVWQDHRTSAACDSLKEKGLTDYVRKTTGLVIDAYFSGTKIKWILDNIPGTREKAKKGKVLFGTVDSWLIWNLTAGKIHVTDYGNAARTLMLDITKLDWDEKILKELDVPRKMLPELRPSSEVYGETDPSMFGGGTIPIAASCGDQHGALFGQTCFEPGMVKNTYGTGASLLMNTGEKPIESKSGLLSTVAWGLNGKVNYALEGLIFISGAVIQWLRDELRIVDDAADTEYFAKKVKDTNGVYLVPAFVGLGGPYWDQWARGVMVGLTRGANRYHIIRAALEAIAFQTRDLIDCMEKDSGIETKEIKVDGGACRNDFLMQFQADILNTQVLRPSITETTARGAAFLAGLAVGFWKDQKDLAHAFELERRFEPKMGKEDRDRIYAGWKKAVERAKNWEEH